MVYNGLMVWNVEKNECLAKGPPKQTKILSKGISEKIGRKGPCMKKLLLRSWPTSDETQSGQPVHGYGEITPTIYWDIRQKIELQPKKVDLIDLKRWLETEAQVKEMACGNSSESKKRKQEEKSKRRRNRQANIFTTHGCQIVCNALFCLKRGYRTWRCSSTESCPA